MLTRIVCTVLLVSVVAGQTASSEKAKDVEPTKHEFVIENFHTESGSVLPQAHLVYGTIVD
jgi:homoserine O-acetyltransferase/O-succinyltransferase